MTGKRAVLCYKIYYTPGGEKDGYMGSLEGIFADGKGNEKVV